MNYIEIKHYYEIFTSNVVMPSIHQLLFVLVSSHATSAFFPSLLERALPNALPWLETLDGCCLMDHRKMLKPLFKVNAFIVETRCNILIDQRFGQSLLSPQDSPEHFSTSPTFLVLETDSTVSKHQYTVYLDIVTV